jgi:hypothetical protein
MLHFIALCLVKYWSVTRWFIKIKMKMVKLQ